jgi:hypothetical protein
VNTECASSVLAVLSTVVAPLAAVAAAVAAFCAARATKKAAQGEILLEFLREYQAPEMSEAFKTLCRWREKHGPLYARRWDTDFKLGDEEAAEVDAARRRVSSFFFNADRLHQYGVISPDILRAAVDVSGLGVLCEAVATLERQINPAVELTFVNRLRKLCPENATMGCLAVTPKAGSST